ncbi:GNAT family N-acetyltransferase [Curtobacterium ammoniigenes]|uniref:GNAT family N-acetyltransferase n=1 Tax=Curtobacterium ammoniigenes TaxID=395387 RepID=UPI00278C75D7|nr:GNAT family protein [Curtobacterium ammoniigenes]
MQASGIGVGGRSRCRCRYGSNVQHDVSLSGFGVRVDPLGESDAGALWPLTDQEMWAGMPVPWPESVDAFAAHVCHLTQTPGLMAFTVRDSGSSAVLGSTAFYDFVPAQRRVEVGWTWYARELWGGPTNPATKLLLFTYAFEELQLNRVALRCDVRNTRSAAAIRRLGAIPEGVLRSHRVAADGIVSDTAYFGITKGEWPEVRRRLEARLAGAQGWASRIGISRSMNDRTCGLPRRRRTSGG